MKKWLWKIQEKIQALKNPSYTARLIDKQRGIVRDSVFTVIGKKEKLGQWIFWKVDKIMVNILNREKNITKKVNFAVKNFQDLEKKRHSLNIYQLVKKAWIPTWTTYRDILGSNAILITLWNKDWGVIFSSNNWSEDSKQVLKNPIDIISNTKKFYQQCYDILKGFTDVWLQTYFDVHMFQYKDWILQMIAGDFDNIKKSGSCYNELFYKNFEEIMYTMIQGEKYFKNGQKLTDNFVAYIKQQDSKDKWILEQDKVNAIMNKVLNSCNLLNSCQ